MKIAGVEIGAMIKHHKQTKIKFASFFFIIEVLN
jgi:uncharacterized membrane protein YsdA (DUF1294 family)